ncbi:MAG: hypothetical protein MK095_08060, partial [Phycisphaerales bacterium]|nr:hypothetical protein [Phycisphaerales bacterium]
MNGVVLSMALVACLAVPVIADEQHLQSPELFMPHVGIADVPLVAHELDLDDAQTEILRQIILDYLESFERRRSEIAGQLQALPSISPEDDPEYRFRREHRTQAATVTNEPEMDDISDRDVQAAQANIRAAFNQELQTMAGRDVLRSQRLELIRSWQRSQDVAWQELLESMEVAVAGARPEHWSAVQRALRRRNTPWSSQFTPEGVNLGAVLYANWGREHSAVAEAFDVIERYDIEYDDALARRDVVMGRTEPLLLDAQEYEYPERMISTSREQIDARVELWKINETFVDRIIGALAEEDAVRFQEYADLAMYPDIYGANRFEHAVAYALSEAELSPQQRIDILSLNEKYIPVMKDVRQERVKEYRVSEPALELQMVEDDALMRCYRSMINARADQAVGERARELKELGNALDRYHREQLRQLIGAQEYDSWPGYADRPRQEQAAGGPVPEDDGDHPVIYLKDMSHTVDPE